jgi:hypothetical protein
MTTAFVLGNGVSRLAVDVAALKIYGSIYGCNALYREFAPDVLISTDRPISERIQNEGYAHKHRMYTRRPISGSGAMTVPQEYYGFSSGPIAVAQACLDGHGTVYLLGFDLGPLPNDRFNNIYADTEFYKKSSARPTFTGNWVRQIQQIVRKFNDRDFIRVMGDVTAQIEQFRGIPNLCHMEMSEFLDRINNRKGV